MNPPELDRDVVATRLSSMRELIADLTSVGGLTVETLATDRLLRHAVERVLIQLVELASAINTHISATYLRKAPPTYRDSFDAMAELGVLAPDLARALKSSVGLRNVLIHEYLKVDLGRVHSAMSAAEQDYSRYIKEVSKWLSRQVTQ